MRRLLSLLPRRRPAAGPPGRTAGPAGGLTAQHRAERRAVARRLHPDLGGDVGEYLTALALVDRRHDPAHVAGTGRGAEERPVHRSWAARRSRLQRRVRRATRSARERLPRHVPGARRYARL